MTKKKKKNLYLGNNPNSPNYDPSIPIGYNRWDEEEAWNPDEDDEEDEEDDEDWRNFPNEDYD